MSKQLQNLNIRDFVKNFPELDSNHDSRIENLADRSMDVKTTDALLNNDVETIKKQHDRLIAELASQQSFSRPTENLLEPDDFQTEELDFKRSKESFLMPTLLCRRN